jgi:hypothetical protein
MDLSRKRTVKWKALGLWPALCLAVPLAVTLLGQSPRTNRPPAEVPAAKSIFVTNDPAGVDPFFPVSTRRKTEPSSDDGKKAPRPAGVGALQLKGIMGPPDRRIALINNLTFAKGEEGEVRVSDGKLKIKCRDIRTKSVVVSIEGQTEEHELILPEKVLPPPE